MREVATNLSELRPALKMRAWMGLAWEMERVAEQALMAEMKEVLEEKRRASTKDCSAGRRGSSGFRPLDCSAGGECLPGLSNVEGFKETSSAIFFLRLKFDFSKRIF